MIVDVLLHDYALSTPSLRPMLANTDKRIYRVERADGASLLLRAFPLQNRANDVLPEVVVLDFLERHSYPAPRIVPTKGGAPTMRCAEWTVLVTEYIEGSVATSEPEDLFHLGALLGRLHSLPVDDVPMPLPDADMLPRKELEWVRGELDAVYSLLPAGRKERAAELRREIDSLDRLEKLSRRLIHNDAHPSNALMTRGGDSVYVDWDGAGLGAPIIDVGFLLMNAALGSVYDPPKKTSFVRAEAVIRGYSRYRSLHQDELGRLRDAMKFRLLVFGVASFVDVAKGASEHEHAHWWGKYQALDALVDRIAARFAANPFNYAR